MPKITKRLVDAATPRADKWFTRDDEFPGFGLVGMPSGVKSYVLRYRTADTHSSSRSTAGCATNS